MNALYGIVFYFFLTGCLWGLAINKHNEDCGTSEPLNYDDIHKLVLWPVGVGANLFVDEKYKKVSSCNETNQSTPKNNT